jgi:hypothetical protein
MIDQLCGKGRLYMLNGLLMTTSFLAVRACVVSCGAYIVGELDAHITYYS